MQVIKETGDAPHFGQLLADVNRQTNGAGTVVDGPGHSLTDPPVGAGGKFLTPGRSDIVVRALQADGSLLNQVQKLQALILVFLGDAHDEPEIGSHHAIPGTFAHSDAMALSCCQFVFSKLLELLHVLDMVSKLNFLGCSQQWDTPDAAEIKTDGISGQTTTLTRR